eukprot:6853943-Alexandrium_andersonii.AAC.1
MLCLSKLAVAPHNSQLASRLNLGAPSLATALATPQCLTSDTLAKCILHDAMSSTRHARRAAAPLMDQLAARAYTARARGTRQVPGPRPPPPTLQFLKYQPGRP